MEKGFRNVTRSLHGPERLRKEGQDRVWERLGFFGGPSVEPTRSPRWSGTDEIDEVGVGQDESLCEGWSRELKRVLLAEVGPRGHRIFIMLTLSAVAA